MVEDFRAFKEFQKARRQERATVASSQIEEVRRQVGTFGVELFVHNDYHWRFKKGDVGIADYWPSTNKVRTFGENAKTLSGVTLTQIVNWVKKRAA